MIYVIDQKKLYNDMTDKIVNAKMIACSKALPFIKDQMIIGLGTGSTVTIFLNLLSEYLLQNDFSIKAISSSVDIREKAKKFNIPLLPPHQTRHVDLYIDGADEFTPKMQLIKGGGGALLCEKIIAQAAHKVIIIADETKYTDILGKFSLPVEIVSFETGIIIAKIQSIYENYISDQKQDIVPRKTTQNTIFKTDMNHIILDVPFERIHNPQKLSDDLLKISGVVEHGLFLDEADYIFTEKREWIK